MYKIKDFFKKVDSDLKVDFYNRLCIKDPLTQPYSESLILVAKSKYMDSVVEKLNKIFEEYKYSYYIEYDTSTISGVDMPSYTIKQNNISIKIEYEVFEKCGYYTLKIIDEQGKKVDYNSWFYKTEEFRDHEYENEFKRAKKQCLEHIEDIKELFNWQMKTYEKSDIRL